MTPEQHRKRAEVLRKAHRSDLAAKHETAAVMIERRQVAMQNAAEMNEG